MTQSIDCDTDSIQESSYSTRQPLPGLPPSSSSSSSVNLQSRVSTLIHGLTAKALEMQSTAASILHEWTQDRILRQQQQASSPHTSSATSASDHSQGISEVAANSTMQEFKGERSSSAQPKPLVDALTQSKASSPSIGEPLLTPFLERADEVELRYVALIADLCNLAYEATNVDAIKLASKHRLELVTHCAQPLLGSMTREQHWERIKAAHASGIPSSDAHNALPSSSPTERPYSPGGSQHASNVSFSSSHTFSSSAARPSSGSSSSSPPPSSLSTSPIDTAVMSFASRVMDTIEECQLEDALDACNGTAGSGHPSAFNSLRPPSPDVEYSLLLGSIEEIFESMDEEETHALTRLLSLSRPPTTEELVFNKLDSMSSGDDYDNVYDPLSVPRPTQPNLPRRSPHPHPHSHNPLMTHEGVPITSTSSSSSSSSPMAIPGARGQGRGGSHGGEEPIMTAPLRIKIEPHHHRHRQQGLHDALPGSPQAKTMIDQPVPPAAWFIADDPETHVRYIVIQGSVSIDHWAINFRFEPVIFEDPSLGVRVHRGVYEAALVLYDDLLPIVQQHIMSSPEGKISLSGHSLGGSLASILMLLFVKRGILSPHHLSPCYTFGAPAVFCACGSSSPLLETLLTRNRRMEQQDECPIGSLLERLGIDDGMLINVMMHKDIVPRAFVCDYTVVADLLKQWMPSFRDHSTLSDHHTHKSLYNLQGTLAVLRPADTAHFVMKDNFHPMLPDTAGLFLLRERPKARHISMLSGSYDLIDDEEEEEEGREEGDRRGGYGRSGVTHGRRDLDAAILSFMNYPHPLQSLSSYDSYGPQGAISRFHNPDNYTKGLEGLC